MRSAGRRLARALWWPFGWAAAVVLVLLPWLAHRVVGAAPTDEPGGWQRRELPGTDPASAAGARAPQQAPGRWRLARGAGWTVVAVGVLAMLPPGQAVRDRLDPPDPYVRRPFVLEPTPVPPGATADPGELVDPDLPAHRLSDEEIRARQAGTYLDDPQWRLAEGWSTRPDGPWRPTSFHRMLDFRSTYINVEGGERRTWRPPACGCRRLTVWMYGGSTTWGTGQRDEHTIASELARVASDDGLVLDVHNHGELGSLQWIEGERLAADLLAEEPPDLVIFYDGVNESWATNQLKAQRSGDNRRLLDPVLGELWDSTGRSAVGFPPAPDGARFIGFGDGRDIDDDEWIATLVARYDRAHRVSRATAEAAGATVRYFWQPNRYTRPLVEGEQHDRGEAENAARAGEAAIRAMLPEDVTDLGDVLDGLLEPTYTDDVHHDERGARVVAEALYAELGADLRRIAGG